MKKLFCDKCEKEVKKLRTVQGQITFKDGFNGLTINIHKTGFGEMCLKCWEENLQDMMKYLKEVD